MKEKRKLVCALLLLALVGLSACGLQEVKRVPPLAEAVELEREETLHTLVITANGENFEFLLAGDELYVSHENIVEQIPLAHPEERRQVLSFAEESFGEFLTVGQEAYLNIDNGQAQYHLQSQGQWVELPETQAYYVGDRLLVIDNTPYEEGGNLYWLDGGERKTLGDERYHYEPLHDNQGLGQWEKGLLLKGYLPGKEAYNLLLKVALPDGETTILAEYTDKVVVDQENIYVHYYQKASDAQREKGVLTKISADSGAAEIIELSNPYASNYGQFTALAGQLYYQDNGYTDRPMIAGAVPAEYYEKVMDQWQASITGTYELFRLGETDSLNSGAVVKLLDRAEDYVYCLFEPENDRLEQRYPCLMVFDRTGQVAFETREVVTKVSLHGDLLCFTVDERYDPESLGKVYWTWLNPEKANG